MVHNHWIISRPKRKLILIPDLLKIFTTVASGQKWYGNRTLQLEFEDQLIKFQWKAENKSKDGSGGRTYASLLFMLGLWFEDKNGVQLTNAGLEIVKGNPPVPVLSKQLLDFQYPSAYSVNRNVNVNRSFQLHPHRLVLKLFIEKGFETITQDEIAFCVIPRAKKDSDLNLIKDIITKYRKNPTPIIQESLRLSEATRDNLRNIGNTVVNQFEYTGLFQERDDIKELTIKADKINDAKKLLKQAKDSLISDPENIAQYQMRYGSGLQISKDYRYTHIEIPKIDANEKAILLTYYEQVINNPIDAITDDLINYIAGLRGVSPIKVKTVLERLAEKPQLDSFEDQYIKLSKGGTETAKSFEIRTTSVFSDNGFGLSALWIGEKPRHPDIFVFFDHVSRKHGIIDTKAYKEYNLPLDHKNKMAHTYIPAYKEIIHNNCKYDLVFFNYVAGGFGSNMGKSFKELLSMSKTSGSYITSLNMIKLLRKHRAKKLSPQEFGNVFSCNKEIIV